MKARKYFGEFLRKFNKMPNRDELITFYYNRYVMANKMSTLPLLIGFWADEFINQYGKVMAEHNITAAKAVELLDKSMPR